MASEKALLPAANIRNLLEEDGLICIEDPIVGERVDQMRRKGFPFLTEEGLDFCRLGTLDDKRVRHVLESCFEKSCLIFYKIFGRDPSRQYTFPETASKYLVVQLWSKGARVKLWGGSHRYPLGAVHSAIGLFQVPFARLKGESTEVEMMQGGLTIIDGRLAFEIVQGFAIMFGFTTPEGLQHWGKMMLEKQEGLVKKVTEMESATIGVNFGFEDQVV